MVTGGLARGYYPNVYRTHAASTDLKAVSGLPKRCACTLTFTNSHDTDHETAVFEGPDGVDVTLTVPAQGSITLYGDFSATGALGADVTCVAGWVDDGSVQLNA